MYSEGSRVSPAAIDGGNVLVRLTTCGFRNLNATVYELFLWLFAETARSKALYILLGVDAVAMAT
jgi:hypothetical protein